MRTIFLHILKINKYFRVSFKLSYTKAVKCNFTVGIADDFGSAIRKVNLH